MKEGQLYYSTVNPQLKNILHQLMKEDLFSPFRLVGGTNLSLREGHRISSDIDLFTDADYGSLDFTLLENYLRKEFKYYDRPDPSNIVGFGRSYYVGETKDCCVKLDLFYTDTFIRPIENIDGIRFASVEDIAAMKLEAIVTGPRKKDYWDIHLLSQKFSFDILFKFYLERNPYGASKDELMQKLIDFKDIDDDFDPICLLNKDWDIIKLDLIDYIKFS